MASVVEEVPFSSYTGNGVATVYAYTFTLLQAADLVATIDGVVTTDFSLSGVGVQGGGNVTFSVAPANGATVLLSRVIGLSRQTEYQYNGPFPASTVNEDFNRIWQAMQGLAAQLGGAVRAPYPEQMTDLPDALTRANSYLVFDASGNPSIAAPASGSAADVLIQLALSSGASKIGFIQSGIGALATTLQARGRLEVWAADFGHSTAASAATNDAALLAAMTAVYTAGGGTVRIASGDFNHANVAYNWAASRTVNIKGQGKKATRLVKSGASTTPIFDLSAPTLVLDTFSEISDLSIFGSGPTVHHGIRLTNVASFNIKNVDIRNCDVAIENLGSLVLEIDNVDAWANRFGYRCAKANGIYPNLIKFRGCTFALNTTYGTDLNNSNSTFFYGSRWEGNGTAANASTGGMRIRADIAEETGFAMVAIYGGYFEGNLGRNFNASSPTSGSPYLLMEGVNLLSSEGGFALNVGSWASVVLNTVIAGSPGDTVTLAADSVSIRNSSIANLADTSTRHIYENVATTGGTTAFEQLGATAVLSVASAAALTLPSRKGPHDIINVTGTTSITSITAGAANAGRIVTLIFAGILTVTDGSNLKIATNFATTQDDTITLGCDGSNWFEIARSVN